MKTIRVALVGIGGFGNQYVRAMLDEVEGKGLELVGVIDPFGKDHPRLSELQAIGGKHYDSLEAFYDDGGQADLVAISTPIGLHAPQSICALEHGSAVLCEKPAAATIQETHAMKAASQKAGLPLAIGYQRSYSEAVQAVKSDILAGKYGQPTQFRVVASWPRAKSYYTRATWAATIGNEKKGWVLDSPAANATAHYLHNALYLLGGQQHTTAIPASIQAELYRAKPIDNYDTAFMRVITEQNTEILFATSHAVPSLIGPTMDYRFTNGRLLSDMQSNRFFGQVDGGPWIDYGHFDVSTAEKLCSVADSLRTGSPVLCDITAASSHLLCINGAQHSPEKIVNFPEQQIITTPDRKGSDILWVDGLQEVMYECFAHGLLPSELPSVDWAVTSKVVDLTDYTHFPTGPVAR